MIQSIGIAVVGWKHGEKGERWGESEKEIGVERVERERE